MSNGIKWTGYLYMSLLSFSAFLLEYVSIFVIAGFFLHVDIWNYTPYQRSIHCIIMAVLWAAVIGSILLFSRRRYDFPVKNLDTEKISSRDWIAAFLCLAACKVMTFIDWHTWKIIGEAKGKSVFSFLTQYLYYIFEVGLVLLIIMFGQKAAETGLKRESRIPFGGIILALTWGVFHFVSRGVGLEIWNGISCMLFSVLGGIMYLKMRKRCLYSYLLLAVGYLL